MDLISILIMILVIVGIFIFPSSIINKIENKLSGKSTSSYAKNIEVVDIKKLRETIQ